MRTDGLPPDRRPSGYSTTDRTWAAEEIDGVKQTLVKVPEALGGNLTSPR
jgi:hypothetical protein